MRQVGAAALLRAGDDQVMEQAHVDRQVTDRFEVLYRATAPRVTAYFLRRTSNPQIAADLAADTFIEAMRSFVSYDPTKGGPQPWVFAIARRVFARHCDSIRRDRELVDQLSGHRQLSQDEVADLLERLDAERPGRRLLQALATRPDSERELVELVALAGLSPKEAAQVLEISPTAARVRLFRARRALREHLQTTGGLQHDVDGGRTW